MATFRLRHFSSPSTLKAIAPDRLLAFLKPYFPFLQGRGLSLSWRRCITCRWACRIAGTASRPNSGSFYDPSHVGMAC
jgi:hypothetical protein